MLLMYGLGTEPWVLVQTLKPHLKKKSPAEYCRAFAGQNCRVVASDIPQRMDDMLDLSSDQIEKIELDVSSDERVPSAVNTVISKYGHIGVLLNNAGIGSTGPLAEFSLDAIKKAWEINTLGELRMVQQVVPHMASWRRGSIANVGIVVGRVLTPWAGSYCSSKAAPHAMTNTLRVELGPFGINAVLVVPGAVRSNFGSSNLERLRNHDWKIYKEFKDAIAERARSSQGSQATDAKLFARNVVKKVLSPKPSKQIVFGPMIGDYDNFLFVVLSWSPLWVKDMFFSTRFNLNKRV
ncbi:short-chain dehydrogenase cctT-like [Durio zibethinus]|uniref:Short-chain dehydrogenase cctT-like n=1 Tax=Durio zibethinus TaxID=66656 RepID=A0A6P5YMM9_DURZI|nr:short-chain dehydrogenase cctT-like [Durio zibethinus]